MLSVKIFKKVLLPFGLGYFLSYLYRTVNGVVAPELKSSLDLDAASLGLLTSAYFVSFAAFQIPLGVLLDRYGARRVESALLLVAAVGALVFARGQSTIELMFGRALIGLGVSGCLMAPMKANMQWLSPKRLPLANGIILTMGGLGAMVATVPTQMALHYTDWRGLFMILAGATIAVALTIILVAPEPSSRSAHEEWGGAFRGAFTVFTQPIFLQVAPLAALAHGSFLAYHGLWAAAWLRDVYGLTSTDVGTVLAFATTGIVVGTFAAGLAAERLARFGISTIVVANSGTCAFILVQIGLVLKIPLPHAVMWTAFAFFGVVSTLYYTALSQSIRPELSGRVSTALNLLVFVVAFLLQWLIGVLLGQWPLASMNEGIAAQAHGTIMTVIVAMQFAALVWLACVYRKRHPR